MASQILQRWFRFMPASNFENRSLLFLKTISTESCKCKNKGQDVVILPKRVEVTNRTKRPSVRRHQYDTNTNPPQDRMSGELDEDDYLSHSVTTYGSKYSAFEAETEKTRDLLRLNSFVRAKTIGNKYFKTAKKPNLLTWACKEQIRYLHQTDPDLWSAEELAQKFPISEISVRKILKSRVRLHRLIDIKEHDLFVKRNWEKFYDSLLSSSNHQAEDEEFICDILANIGNMENIDNIFSLQNEMDAKHLSKASKPRKLGVFSSMVKDEIEKKEIEHNNLFEKHQEDLDKLRNILTKVKQFLSDSEDFQRSGTKDNNSKFKESLSESKRFQNGNKNPLIQISSPNSSEKSNIYPHVVDGCAYDEHGDFLYRIP